MGGLAQAIDATKWPVEYLILLIPNLKHNPHQGIVQMLCTHAPWESKTKKYISLTRYRAPSRRESRAAWRQCGTGKSNSGSKHFEQPRRLKTQVRTGASPARKRRYLQRQPNCDEPSCRGLGLDLTATRQRWCFGRVGMYAAQPLPSKFPFDDGSTTSIGSRPSSPPMASTVIVLHTTIGRKKERGAGLIRIQQTGLALLYRMQPTWPSPTSTAGRSHWVPPGAVCSTMQYTAADFRPYDDMGCVQTQTCLTSHPVWPMGRGKRHLDPYFQGPRCYWRPAMYPTPG